MSEQTITVQVLNGATGEVREVRARVKADSEQGAVDKLMGIARQDDSYYRFLGIRGLLKPTAFASTVTYSGSEYFGRV
jgi:hypothetical protein